ncbi:molecular chaperone DnaJ [Bifidobacterium aquikefiri]|uniref:molecular chaperone DnaJ n=1 Tax=Bifidobacterium aquikefiri TaxID=1653207 RepID=UPI0039EC5584
MADYYEVLGVTREASEDEIKRAYRKMSRKYHPDIAGPQFEDKFKEVNNAYDVLSDPQKKQMYDQGVDPNNPQASAGFGQGAQGFDGFGDIFGQFFGSGFGSSGQGPIPRTQAGRDALSHVNIDLKTAIFGGVAHTTIHTYGLCPDCGGAGTRNGEKPVTCPDCKGQGFRQKVVRTMLGQMMTSAPCERCEGHGTIIEHPCQTCMGHGRVQTKRSVGVTIPAGITDDSRLRLASQGEVGEGGGAAGDLYIDISINPDPQYTRDGDNLHCWIQIPMSWAVLGHDIDIDTFDGKKTLSIPAGCQSEDAIPLKGLGVTKLRSQSERGDLVAHMVVDTPTKLNDKEEKLMMEFAKLHDADAHHTTGRSRPKTKSRKGFFGRIKDALG